MINGLVVVSDGVLVWGLTLGLGGGWSTLEEWSLCCCDV